MLVTLARLLVKLPLVWATATAMGCLGLSLMYWGTPVRPVLGEFWTNYVAAASIFIWSVAGIVLRNHNRLGWLFFGLVSPLFGALLVAPPASFAFVIAKGYIAFPVGLVTGLLVYYVSRSEFPAKLLRNQHKTASAYFDSDALPTKPSST